MCCLVEKYFLLIYIEQRKENARAEKIIGLSITVNGNGLSRQFSNVILRILRQSMGLLAFHN